MSEKSDIQYLTVVQCGAQRVFDLAASGYGYVKRATLQLSPPAVENVIAGTEQRLQPVLDSYFTLSHSILKLADTVVATGLSIGTDAVSSVQTKSKSAVEHIQTKVESKIPKDLVSDVKSNAQSRYTSAHDALVSNPKYAQMYQLTLDYAKWLASLSMVQKSAGVVGETVYPRLKGVVDPVRTKVEPYVKAIEEHLEPRVTSSPLAVSVESTGSD